VEHYPGKTLISSIRQLRLALLPALKQIVETSGWRPRYSAAANELYHIGQLSDGEKSALRNRWRYLRAKLRKTYSDSDNKDLFALMVKGDSLFEKSTVNERRSFLEISSLTCESGVLSATLATKTHDFAESFLPPATAGALKLKSYIHNFAHLNQNGRYSLKEETVEDLYGVRKDILEALPEFKLADRTAHFLGRGHHQSPVLNKLFDQSVFQDFRFVTRAA